MHVFDARWLDKQFLPDFITAGVWYSGSNCKFSSRAELSISYCAGWPWTGFSGKPV